MIMLILEIVLAMSWVFLVVHSMTRLRFSLRVSPWALGTISILVVLWAYLAFHPEL